MLGQIIRLRIVYWLHLKTTFTVTREVLTAGIGFVSFIECGRD